MALFALTTTMNTKNGDQVWFPFETEEYEGSEEGLLEMMDDLNEGILVSGYRLKVRRQGDVLHELERDPIVIGKELVKQIVIMNPNKMARQA